MLQLRALLGWPLAVSFFLAPLTAEDQDCFFGQEVDILRDSYGVPHVFGESDGAAYFGLGYACAEDRYFQMTYHRIQMEGRTAEFLGRGVNDPSNPNLADVYLDWDKEIRTYGYSQLADRLIANMNPKGFSLLQSYASGVDRFRRTLDPQNPPALFATYGLPHYEPWTIKSSVLIWLRLGRTTRSTQGKPTSEIDNLTAYDIARGAPANLSHEEAVLAVLGTPLYDEDVASVLESDVPRDVRGAMFEYAKDNGLLVNGSVRGSGQSLTLDRTGPTFSEAWASNGSLTDAPALYGGPKTRVSIPNDTWEGHMVSPNFNARGATLPGSPNFLYGSTDRAAWGVTQFGMDQVDLYEIELVPGGDKYSVTDENKNVLEIDLNHNSVETIAILGEAPANIIYKETEDFGPVITSLINNTGGKQYASLSVPFYEKREPTIDYYRMYKAPRVPQFRTALGRISYPNINLVYAHEPSPMMPDGSCGYSVVGSLALRSTNIDVSPLGGSGVQDGTSLLSRWIEIVPPDLKPWVLNPASGFAWSANNLPVGSWYPIPLNRGGGYTFRGARLLESLQALTPGSTPASAIRDIQRDTTLTNARGWGTLAIHLRDNPIDWDGDMIADTFEVNEITIIRYLERFIDDHDSKLDHVDGVLPSAVASRFLNSERALTTDPVAGFTSDAHFLREKIEGINMTPSIQLTADEAFAVKEVIGRIWTRMTALNVDDSASTDCGLPGSPDPDDWEEWYVGTPDEGQIYCAPCDLTNCGSARYGYVKHWRSFFESLPPLSTTETWAGPSNGANPTMLQGFSMGYSQFCEYRIRPSCETLLWYGQSEDSTSAHFDDQYSIWQDNEAAEFKDQPYSRTELEALPGTVLSRTLCWTP